MKYNEQIASEYGAFVGGVTVPPAPYKPMPMENDYKKGTIKRFFVKRINSNRIFEISSEQANNTSTDLYIIVPVTWTISGVKENRVVNGILEYGVANLNKFEIERIKKENLVDLSSVLVNPLEYWRGH